jgi:hypothetical protein
MPLPRVRTRTLFKQFEHEEAEQGELRPHVRLPDEVVDIIVAFAMEFETAREKQYHYSRFAQRRECCMHRSPSRLQLYARELKALSMAHVANGAHQEFPIYALDRIRCKYPPPSYDNLKALMR